MRKIVRWWIVAAFVAAAIVWVSLTVRDGGVGGRRGRAGRRERRPAARRLGPEPLCRDRGRGGAVFLLNRRFADLAVFLSPRRWSAGSCWPRRGRRHDPRHLADDHGLRSTMLATLSATRRSSAAAVRGDADAFAELARRYRALIGHVTQVGAARSHARGPTPGGADRALRGVPRVRRGSRRVRQARVDVRLSPCAARASRRNQSQAAGAQRGAWARLPSRR